MIGNICHGSSTGLQMLKHKYFHPYCNCLKRDFLANKAVAQRIGKWFWIWKGTGTLVINKPFKKANSYHGTVLIWTVGNYRLPNKLKMCRLMRQHSTWAWIPLDSWVARLLLNVTKLLSFPSFQPYFHSSYVTAIMISERK